MSFLQLYPNPNLRPEIRGAVVERVDIIAVPGINSSDNSTESNALDTFTTTTRDGRRINWLQDPECLPHVVPHSRVLLFCYNAFEFFNNFSLHTLLALIQTFLNLVLDLRKGDPYRPIIFIGHSLGGVVIKQALLLAFTNPAFAFIKDATQGILFFGTPHRVIRSDSSIESIVATVLDRLFLRKPSWKRDNKSLKLRNKSLKLRNKPFPLHSSLLYNPSYTAPYTTFLGTLSIVSFYESVGLVVPKLNTTLGVPGEVVTSLDASHRDLCRYESPQALNYKIVEDAILSLVEKAFISNPYRKDFNYSDAQLLHLLSSSAHGVPRYRISKNLRGTSEWLLSHHLFSRWMYSRGKGILWIVGNPGVGKSTLARFVADKLQNSSIYTCKCLRLSSEESPNELEIRTPRVLSFFCSYADPPRTAVAVLRSLLYQLLTAQPSLSRYISSDDRLRCGQQTAQASLLSGLLAHVAEYVDIFVFIDALDELDELVRVDLLDALVPKLPGLLTTSPAGEHEVSKCQVHSYPPQSPSFKIFFTSRPEVYRELVTDSSAYTINLSQCEAAKSINHDIGLYVRSNVNQYARQSVLQDSQKKAIEKRLVENANGMFLRVKLQLKMISALETGTHDIFSVLANLPNSLENLYLRELEAIQRQPPVFADISLKTLEWIALAHRPLHICELHEIFGLGTKSQMSTSLSQEYLNVASSLDYAYGSFIIVDEFDSTVRFIHQTAKDFLLRYFISRPSKPNKEIGWSGGGLAQACLSYLDQVVRDLGDSNVRCIKCSSSQTQSLIELPTVLADLLQEFPFLEYASIFWYSHVGSISVKHDDFSATRLGGLVHVLSDPKSASFRIWFPIYWLSHCINTWERSRYPKYPTELIVQAFLGNETEIRNLLRGTKGAVDKSTPAGEEWTPLMAAAWMGYESVVDLLLEYRAGDNAQPQQNCWTVVQTIERGHIKIAQKLIERFSRIQSLLPSQQSIFDVSVSERCITPLVASIRGGYKELVMTCLSFGADINESGFQYFPSLLTSGVLPFEIELALPMTPLGAAISSGSMEISRDLLHSGVDINSSNALFISTRASNNEFLKLLLDNGADVNTTYPHNAKGGSPLHYAALYGDSNMVKRLISHGAEVNSKDKLGRTPFQLAFNAGKLEVVKALLENSNQLTINKNEALLHACRLADIKMATFLLGAGASAQTIRRHKEESVLEYLFVTKDVPNLEPRDIVVSKYPHQGSRVAVLELLYRQGADLKRTDSCGNTYLQLAAYRRWPIIVKSLLGFSKIDVNHQNIRGETAIDIVAQFGDWDLCRTLIRHGATVRQSTFQNFLSSGSQTGILCLMKEMKGAERPRLEFSMDSVLLKNNSQMTKSFENSIYMFSGKFKKAVEFLAVRSIDHLENVKLTTQNNFSFGNTMKSWVEDTSGTPWIWWPLTPRLHPLKPGEVWLEWLCQGGSMHREKVSSIMAQDIQQLVHFQRQSSCDDTNGQLWETLQALFTREKSDCTIESSQPNGQNHWLDFQYDRKEVLTINPELQDLPPSTWPPPSNLTSHPPRTVNVPPPGACFQAPRRQVTGRRLNKRHRRLVPPILAPNFGVKAYLYVLFKVGENTITHIDAGVYNTDQSFFDELKRVYKRERGWLRGWFSIWRYHHCNFDKYIRSRDNLISAQSTGARTSNFLPIPPHDIDYEFIRIASTGGEAPITQMEFRSMFRACSRLCCWWFRLTHKCRAPTNIYRLPSHLQPPTNGSLQLIPKRKVKWDIFENCRGEAWGLTPFELPCFCGFVIYFFLSVTGPIVFWMLWLSYWQHEGDLQNAAVPASVVLTLCGLLCQWCSGGNWNTDKDSE